MGFMEPVMTKRVEWVTAECRQGTSSFPLSLLSSADAEMVRQEIISSGGDARRMSCLDKIKDYTEAWRVEEIERLSLSYGYGVRLSAPGYMDCTEWEVYTDEKEAQARYDQLVAEDEEEDS